MMQFELEAPGLVGRERQRSGHTSAQRQLQVVAVQVQFVCAVGRHADQHLRALRHAQHAGIRRQPSA